MEIHKFEIIILLTSSKNQIYEFRIPNIYKYFFNNIRLMYTLCFLVASVKLKVYKKVVKFSFKQQKILGIRNLLIWFFRWREQDICFNVKFHLELCFDEKINLKLCFDDKIHLK